MLTLSGLNVKWWAGLDSHSRNVLVHGAGVEPTLFRLSGGRFTNHKLPVDKAGSGRRARTFNHAVNGRVLYH